MFFTLKLYEMKLNHKTTFPALFSLIYLVSLSGCNTENDEPNVIQKETVIQIPVAESEAVDAIPFENVKIFPLEASKESLIGEVSKVMFANGRYHILDRQVVKGVLVFDDQGQFLFKIRKRGRGPGEYAECYDMDVDEEGNIYVLDVNNRKIIRYDSNGRFAEEHPYQIPSMGFSKIAQDTFAMYQFQIMTEDQGQQFDLVYWTTQQQRAKKYFPYEPVMGSRTRYVFQNFFRSSEALLFHLSFSDTVYQVANAGLEARYVLDFGRHTVPQTVKSMNNDEVTPFIESNSYAWKKSNFFENKTHFVGGYRLDEEMGMFVYEKGTGQTMVYSPQDIEWLDLWSVLPMGHRDETTFYGFIHKENIRYLKEFGDPSGAKYPFIEKLLQMDPDQIENPLIVTYQLPTNAKS